jgi:hypothetical protein
MAGGLALGFAASRMLKASSSRRHGGDTTSRPAIPAATSATNVGDGIGGDRFTRPAPATTPVATPAPAPVAVSHAPRGPGGL